MSSLHDIYAESKTDRIPLYENVKDAFDFISYELTCQFSSKESHPSERRCLVVGGEVKNDTIFVILQSSINGNFSIEFNKCHSFQKK